MVRSIGRKRITAPSITLTLEQRRRIRAQRQEALRRLAQTLASQQVARDRARRAAAAARRPAASRPRLPNWLNMSRYKKK